MVIFNERRTPIATTLNLLVLPAAIIRPTTRLGPKLNNILIQEMGDGAEIRETYSGITTQVIHLADSNRDQKKVALACETLLDTLAGLLNLKESIRSLEPVLEQGPTDIKQQVLKALEHRIDLAKVGDHSAQAACLNFLPRLEGLLIDDSAPAIKHTALGCVDRIADKFGKLDTGKMSHIASIISGNSCLGSKNSRLEEMSIICLTTLAEVLKDAMLPILPRTIPQTLDLLDQFLSEPSSGILHNTMYSFFEALFLYIPWIMTGEFLDRLLTVSYKSANAGLDISCNNIRQDTLNILSKQVDVHACFSSLTRTWKASTAEGVEVGSLYFITEALLIRNRQSRSS